MKLQIKNIVKASLNGTIKLFLKTQTGRYFSNRIIGTAMEQVAEISHHSLELKFATPNELCRWRAKTFASKEPETLEWIDQMQNGAVLWDIGANVGLYSVYAAKKSNCRIYAFEPSVFNLELLARNASLNDVTSNICIVPVALSDKLGTSNMRLTTTEWGGALSTFGQDFGWDGKKINKVFEFQTVGLSMEDAMNLLKIPQPDYIKIDVDGLEHFILKGGSSVLNNIKQILIEINDDFVEQANDCRNILTEAGLTLLEKRHSDMFTDNALGFQNSYNQIWAR